MNILFICDEYPPGLIGGIGSITQSLCRQMVKEGHNVSVVGLYSYEFGGKDFETDEGVRVWRLRYGFRLPPHKKFYGAQRRLPDSLKQILFANRDFQRFTDFVTKLIRDEKINIVESPDWLSYAYFTGHAHPVLPSLNVPLVMKFHGSHTYACHELKIPVIPSYAAVDRQQYERADFLSAVSMHTAEVSRELFGTKKPIQVLHNSVIVPATIQQSKRSDSIVLYSGTLKETKGVFSLLKAWNIVAEQRPDARLELYGKGDIPALKNIVHAQYRESVHFKGHQPREVLLAALEEAALAVYPSYIEAFSMAPLESMSRACPTIYTTRSSGREVISEGENGLLVDPDDVQDIAGKILRLLSDKDLRLRLGNAGRTEVMKRFELGHSVAAHIAFYEKAIKAFGNG